eukprot:SM000075S21997  [mRNA]  locus=s75:524242:526161:- [translate_table: standard]
MFPEGAAAYIDDIAALIPLGDGGVRLALDTGCGVASWGAYLLSRNILAMSFAPRDSHEAQVQFALERGVPAMLGILATKRLPYPARAFDLAHCSRCLIPWASSDGELLLEVDRVLRPGGYWVLSGPPINWRTHHAGWKRTPEDLEAEQAGIEDLTQRLCWTKVVEQGNLAVWQKPLNNECARKRPIGSLPPLCPESSDPDHAWYTPMEACITRMPEVSEETEVAGGSLLKWPARLQGPPPRISTAGLVDAFEADSALWRLRVAKYKAQLLPPMSTNTYRNIMDVNSGFGGFAAALAEDPVWVMNTVPPMVTNDTLGIIHERGLIGVYHDWCEPFSTYPRTYDLIHASGIFALTKERCNMSTVLLEMDRILRPEGALLIRDHIDFLGKAKQIAKNLRWDARLADHESGSHEPEKVFIAVKRMWTYS